MLHEAGKELGYENLGYMDEGSSDPRPATKRVLEGLIGSMFEVRTGPAALHLSTPDHHPPGLHICLLMGQLCYLGLPHISSCI